MFWRSRTTVQLDFQAGAGEQVLDKSPIPAEGAAVRTLTGTLVTIQTATDYPVREM